MKELIDIYTVDRQLIGKTCPKGSKLAQNEYRIVVMTILINQYEEILITKRSKDKIAGGKWECTAGSVQAGETSKAAIIREINEEIGVTVEIGSEPPILGYTESNALFDIWIINANIQINELVLQKEEVDDAKYVTLSELKEIIKTNNATKSLNEVVKLLEKQFMQ